MTDWQPIETAPRDGTRVLLFRGEWMESMGIGYWSNDWMEFTMVGGECFPGPTHWMPLPPPPVEKT